MHEVINQERSALQVVMERVRTISDSTFYEYNAVAILGNELADFVRIRDEIDICGSSYGLDARATYSETNRINDDWYSHSHRGHGSDS